MVIFFIKIKIVTDMQFEMNHKVGTDYSTVKFDARNFDTIKFKLSVIESFENSFSRLGGKFQDDYSWKFPAFITSEVIQEIIRNTCFVCGGLMEDSTAFQNSNVLFNDFGDDAGSRGTTQSRVGPAQQIKVRKCKSCGHSHT